MRQNILELLLFCVIFAGCYPSAERVEITEVRKVDVAHRSAMPILSTTARMGLADADATLPISPHGDIPPPMLQSLPSPEVSDGPAHLDPARLDWSAPQEWRLSEERPMRLATYVPADAENSECAVTMLSGIAGGIPANLNRWRAQLGLEPLTDEALAALPRWDMLGTQAVYISSVDVTGETMLYGVICPVPGGLLFVKMTGPYPEMESEEERFKEFCLSMRFKEE